LPAASAPTKYSAVTPDGDARKTARISVGEMRKYAHLTADDMLTGLKMAQAALPAHMQARAKLSDLEGILSAEYIKTALHKTAAEFKHATPPAVKSYDWLATDYAEVQASAPR